VPRTADPDAIRSSFRRLARKYHPDVSTEPDAEARFKEISEAYATLTDPARRRQHDRQGLGGQRAPAPGNGTAPDLHDLFHDLFGGNKKETRPARGQHRKSELTLPFLDAILGTTVKLTLNGPGTKTQRLQVKVPSGAADGDTLRIRGKGYPPRGGGPCGDLLLALHVSSHALLTRDGLHLEMAFPMTVLEALEGGTFDVPTPSGTIQVNVPAGACSGQRIRLRGRGVTKGVEKGDLFLVVRVEVPPANAESVLAAQSLEKHYPDIRAHWSL
jgi:curved DNA-binding protein